MTIKNLLEIMKKNNIPLNVHIMSDSGWECDATEMEGIWYNRETNTMIFTQHGDQDDNYADCPLWLCIFGTLEGLYGKSEGWEEDL